MSTDYLILGSGLAGLSFGALMAHAGKKVVVLEANEYPGGFGHTFIEGNKYRFNAQLHYVWGCRPGRNVNKFLRKLNLAEVVTFEEYDRMGYDHMRIPGYSLDIPSSYDLLIERLVSLFPKYNKNINRFIQTVCKTSAELDRLPAPLNALPVLLNLPKCPRVIKYHNATLQDVFDEFSLPLEAQALLASQWLDFLLPPKKLSFFAWVVLFCGYCHGAYYPTRHFEFVINSLVKKILDQGGKVRCEKRVIDFILDNKKVRGVIAEDTDESGKSNEYLGKAVICNIDPRKAAEMIGFEKFSKSLRNKINYDYSPSNFVAYCVVKDLNLRNYGFGKWNLFHSEKADLNEVFDDMYRRGDYSKPSFAVTVPTLLTKDHSDCPEGTTIIQFLTVADYKRFSDLKNSNAVEYRRKKKEVFDAILDVMERDYIPDLRKHLIFKMTGSPTTNEHFCGSPAGNSYGSNMSPLNLGVGRLDHRTSLENFYFCNASSGYAGFAGTIGTGCRLYETLASDDVLGQTHF